VPLPAKSKPGSESDTRLMRLAIAEARRGTGTTSPNPAVGAVIARKGVPLAVGHHRKAGGPHAEIAALRHCPDPAGATLYVTLEPCSTRGRTPACTDAIIASGIRRVVIGTLDPNPAHAGRAIPILEAAGISITSGLLQTECHALNPAFNKWITTRMPHVIAKAALSLDGRISRPPHESRWLSCPASRSDAHALRASADAILVGAGTLRADNPRLTVRGKHRSKPQPWRVVVAATSSHLPASAHLFTDEHADRTLVFRGKPLRAILRELGERDITGVLIEGGSRVLGEAFDERLVDSVRFYLTPWLVAGPTPCIGGSGVGASGGAPRIIDSSYRRCGPDLILSGNLEYASRP
jgi:diaminohydroxyphosphoribosylaminopyrimidine deaminase/5-amino-6-(5-phosphoribosylamino)uracil reductase